MEHTRSDPIDTKLVKGNVLANKTKTKVTIKCKQNIANMNGG